MTRCRWCHTPIDELPNGTWVHGFTGSVSCGNFTHKAEPEIARTRQEDTCHVA